MIVATDITRVLLIEDNPADADLIREQLIDRSDAPPHDIEHVSTLQAALARLSVGGVHLILLDLDLPDSRGLATVTRVIERAPSVPLIVIAGFNAPEVWRRALDVDVPDYSAKDGIDRLVQYLRAVRLQNGVPRCHAKTNRPATRVRRVLIFEPDQGLFVPANTVLEVSGYDTGRVMTPMGLLTVAATGNADLILLGVGSGVDESPLLEQLTAVTTTPIIGLYPAERLEPEGAIPEGVAVWLPRPPSCEAILAALHRISGVDSRQESPRTLAHHSTNTAA